MEAARFIPFGTSHLATIAAILLVSVGVSLWVRRITGTGYSNPYWKEKLSK